MARRKAGIAQKDFSLGEVKPESIERDDVELVNRSLKKALNTMILVTGAIRNRPGAFYVTNPIGSDVIEIEPADGVFFFLEIVAGGVIIRNSDGTESVSFDTATWEGSEDVWINNLGDTILMGSKASPVHALTYEDSVFSFGQLAFASGSGNSTSQPYWSYRRDITMRPSATSGSVTLTASGAFFTDDYIGTRIRYQEREIQITAVSSTTVATGTVIDTLNPTVTVTVGSASGFRIGDAVEHSVDGGQGIITDIDGSDIDILVTKYFTGFAGTGTDNDLIGPNAKSEISASTSASPAATSLWDEQLMSPARGYAGSSSEHKGRVILNDFPQAPNVIAISAADTYNDFKVGTNDDDAIIDTIGSKSTRVLHAVSAEDLVILCSDGCHYQETRDGTLFSPSTWSPVKFDRLGASAVRPARVSDGLVFLSKNGSNVMGAVLQGDVYKAWTVIPLSEFHSHLIKTPISIGATDGDSDRPERLVFLCNTDGTAAVMRWERGAASDSQSVGWVPWETQGSYKRFFMAFGQIHSIVERTFNGSTTRVLERMSDEAFVDNAANVPGSAEFVLSDETPYLIETEDGYFLAIEAGVSTHLSNAEATVYLAGYDYGELTIDESGYPVDEYGNIIVFPAIGTPQIGWKFNTEVTPWPRRSVDSAHGIQEARRIIRMGVSFLDTIRFTALGEQWGNYTIGEDTEVPPDPETGHAYFTNANRDDYPDLPIVRDRPGPFTLTALRFKVQV